MKKAIITGITGQDGYLLSKYLKKKKLHNSWIKQKAK